MALLIIHNYLLFLTASMYTGHLILSGNMSFTLNTTDNSFTLTCISTGGPATTVTWTRYSTIVTEGTETVLNDPVTANYTHTLLVSDRRIGLYTCIIANEVSNISAKFNVQGKTKHNCLQYIILCVYTFLNLE